MLISTILKRYNFSPHVVEGIGARRSVPSRERGGKRDIFAYMPDSDTLILPLLPNMLKLSLWQVGSAIAYEIFGLSSSPGPATNTLLFPWDIQGPLGRESNIHTDIGCPP